MVWNTTQSAFYKAIDAYNNGERPGGIQDEIHGEECRDDNTAKMPSKEPPKEPDKNGEAPCCPQGCNEAPKQMNCPRCPACRNSSPAPLSKLFSDNDMLLIAGLILILSRQNADRKLILALAFVLLT